MSYNKRMRLKAEKQEAKAAKRAAKVMAEARPVQCRALSHFGNEVRPVAKKAGKRPQVGREGRHYLFAFTPNGDGGRAKAERFWLNDPREVFRG